MSRRFVLQVGLGILLIAALAGAGTWLYDVGVAHGLAAAAQSSGQAVPTPAAGYFGYHHAWGGPWAFFGIFRFLIPIFWILLILAVVRGIWGRPYRRWGYDGGGSHPVPPQVEAWHRRMHEADAESPKES